MRIYELGISGMSHFVTNFIKNDIWNKVGDLD